jgi:hypothetical protein
MSIVDVVSKNRDIPNTKASNDTNSFFVSPLVGPVRLKARYWNIPDEAAMETITNIEVTKRIVDQCM